MSVLENVSRETLADIEEYENLIRKWSPSINLIAKSTIPDIRERHILDSSQLFPLIPNEAGLVCDIGSGGGLPGLVLAILAKEERASLRFNLIESDQRKAAFLRTVSINLGLNTEIIVDRIESVNPVFANVVMARALAPLPKLLGYVSRHLSDDGIALLQKGRDHLEEVALAREFWDFDLEVVPNEDDATSVILRIKDLREKGENGS